jgi:hypothetical protein
MFTFTYGMPLPRMRIVVPQRDMEIFSRMRRVNNSAEFRAYTNALLQLIGSRAVQNAGKYVRATQPQGKPRLSPLTLQLREAAGDHSKAALYQTGQLLKGIFAEVNGATLEFGVRGPRAGVARIQENGFVVRTSEKMARAFVSLGRQIRSEQVIGWAKNMEPSSGARLGEDTKDRSVIKIPKRPFLAPSLARAANTVLQSKQLQGLDAAFVEVVAKKILGGVVEFDSLNKFGMAYTIRPVT